MTCNEVVLCIGMHRSGTSLTASLLESLGLCLPGELIAADSANLSGYFENRSIVDAQEQLLQDLGYWWPTDHASYGMPVSVVSRKFYRDYVDWLTDHLSKLFDSAHSQIVVKDPRTSLLLPAWREAAGRLNLTLRVIICVRNPRDVCWSLVCRDGNSVGMSWSRAQRLWMGHYKSLLYCLGDVPALVVRYEHWLDPNFSTSQLKSLGKFVGLNLTTELLRTTLSRIRPELNHGGLEHLPPVDRSLRLMYKSLIRPGIDTACLVRNAYFYSFALEVSRIIRALRQRLHVLWLQSPWRSRALGVFLHPPTLRQQLGNTSFRAYRRSFRKHPDLRPHPLISPAYLNSERSKRHLPPITSADDLFRYLLYPDLLPLNTHPWFDCRDYQIKNGQFAQNTSHPIISYLRESRFHQSSSLFNSTCQLPWLIELGAHLDSRNEEHLPELISRLHPGLILSDPIAFLGAPEDGVEQLIANENYWKKIQALFDLWPDSDPDAPLSWLVQQPYYAVQGLTDSLPAIGYKLWWVSGHWEAQVLADLAGADISQSREFPDTESLYRELLAMVTQPDVCLDSVLISLTPSLYELFLAGSFTLPDGVAILNLMWPSPSQQSSWLHFLAQASFVLECRAAIRSFFLGLGFKSMWPRPIKSQSALQQSDAPTLLLAFESSPAEAQLAAAAPVLNADRYDAYFRLDAELQSKDPLIWLNEKCRSYSSWLLLNPLLPASNPKAHSVLAWAHHHGVKLQILSDPPETLWLNTLHQ